MTSYYKLIVGGSELTLDPEAQWDDATLRDFLSQRNPLSFPLAGGGQVSVVPGPGVAIVREEGNGGSLY